MARNAAIPAYSEFLGTKTVPEWTAAMGADVSLTTVSRCTWMLMQLVLVPSRERMLQGLRYYRADAFDVSAKRTKVLRPRRQWLPRARRPMRRSSVTRGHV
eukprot:COSAG02_NODE_179_length_31090_cov_49.813785_31_plen_101_part_00